VTNEAPRNRRFALRLNIFLLRLTRNWLRVALTLVGIYSALPFIAPTLMKLGVTGPASVIYTVYGAFCHQFAFRTFFLFGEQPAYPRANTGSELTPFESYAAQLPEFAPDRITALGPVGELYAFTPGFQWASREFVGNEQMGYKLTLCERDIAIYTAIFVGGIAFSKVRRRLRPVPIGLYILLGLGPIAVDGISQLLGYPPFMLWPPRETLPIFRVITGALFGFMNAWLAFPHIEVSMRETRHEIEAKLARAGIQI
jgi:uncharacterized membrane protein